MKEKKISNWAASVTDQERRVYSAALRKQKEKVIFDPKTFKLNRTVEEGIGYVDMDVDMEGVGHGPAILGAEKFRTSEEYPGDEAVKMSANVPINKYITDLKERVAGLAPEVANAFRLPKYEQPGGYHPTHWLEFAFTLAMLNIIKASGDAARAGFTQKPSLDVLGPYYCTIASKSEGFPLYWVGKDLVDSLMHTNPPMDLELPEIHWPRQAMTFLFPQNSVRFDKDELFALTVVHAPKGEWLESPTELKNLNFVPPSINFPREYVALWGFGIDHEALKRGAWEYVITTWYMAAPYSGSLKDFLNDSRLSDPKGEVVTLTKLLFNLILVMQARPQLVDPKRHLKTVMKKKGVKQDWWAPRFIGKNYRIKGPSLGGTHASPRMHWRDGHMRMQPYGPKHSLRKPLWIEAHVVGAGEKES